MAANTTVSGGTLRLVGKRQTVTSCGTNPRRRQCVLLHLRDGHDPCRKVAR